MSTDFRSHRSPPSSSYASYSVIPGSSRILALFLPLFLIALIPQTYAANEDVALNEMRVLQAKAKNTFIYAKPEQLAQILELPVRNFNLVYMFGMAGCQPCAIFKEMLAKYIPQLYANNEYKSRDSSHTLSDIFFVYTEVSRDSQAVLTKYKIQSVPVIGMAPKTTKSDMPQKFSSYNVNPFEGSPGGQVTLMSLAAVLDKFMKKKTQITNIRVEPLSEEDMRSMATEASAGGGATNIPAWKRLLTRPAVKVIAPYYHVLAIVIVLVFGLAVLRKWYAQPMFYFSLSMCVYVWSTTGSYYTILRETPFARLDRDGSILIHSGFRDQLVLEALLVSLLYLIICAGLLVYIYGMPKVAKAPAVAQLVTALTLMAFVSLVIVGVLVVFRSKMPYYLQFSEIQFTTASLLDIFKWATR